MKFHGSHVFYDLPARDYHADPCLTPSLSQSCATTIIQRSALHARHEHPRFGAAPRERTYGQRKGALSHAMLLDRGPEVKFAPVIHIHEGEQVENYRTKAAQALRDAAISEGKEPLLPREFDLYRGQADRIAQNFRDAGLNLWHADAKHEVSVLWEDEGVQCRGRLDYLHVEGGRADIVDVKAVSLASASKLMRVVYDQGYDIQREAYVRAVSIALGVSHVRFRFAFYEPEPPFAVCVVELDGSFQKLGAARWARARDTWRKCLESGDWPGYAPAYLGAPHWALEQEGVVE